VLFLVSLAPAFLLGRHAVSAVKVDIERLEGSPIPIGDSELAVWTDQPALATGTECRLRSRGIDTPVLRTTDTLLTVTSAGRAWRRLAIIDDASPGSAQLACRHLAEPVAPDNLGVSENPDLRSFTVSLVIAVLVPVVAAAVAGVLVIAVALLRQRARPGASPPQPYLPPPA